MPVPVNASPLHTQTHSKTRRTQHHALLSDLERISRDLSTHREKISLKLVAIVKGMMDAKCARAVAEAEWDPEPGAGSANPSVSSASGATDGESKSESSSSTSSSGATVGKTDASSSSPSSSPSSSTSTVDSLVVTAAALAGANPAKVGPVSPFVVAVGRATAQMHKVLSSVLPDAEVATVFARILSMINKTFPSYFRNVSMETPVGKARVLRDVSHLLTCLRSLRGVKPGAMLMLHFKGLFGIASSAGAHSSGMSSGGGGGE